MSPERRSSHRFNVPQFEQQALLKIGQIDHPVVMLDESAGGFRVAAPGALRIEVDDELLLRSNMGWHRVKVRRLEPTKTGVNIGLERLEDVPEKYKGAGLVSLLADDGSQKGQVKTGGGVFSGIMLVLGVCVAIWGWSELTASGFYSDMATKVKRSEVMPSRKAGADRRAEQTTSDASSDLGFRLGNWLGAGSTVEETRLRIQRLGNLSSFATARQLGLSASQRSRLRAIYDDAYRELGTAADASDQAAKLRSAERKAMGVLSLSQRAELRRIESGG